MKQVCFYFFSFLLEAKFINGIMIDADTLPGYIFSKGRDILHHRRAHSCYGIVTYYRLLMDCAS